MTRTHTCSTAWVVRLFTLDFCPKLCWHATWQQNIFLFFCLSASMKMFGIPCRSFARSFKTAVFAHQYISIVPGVRAQWHSPGSGDVPGTCMKEDTNSKDGCPLGYHAEACDCYWRRGTPARWRCGKANNKGLDACCCSNIVPWINSDRLWPWQSLSTSRKGMTEMENCSHGFKFRNEGCSMEI